MIIGNLKKPGGRIFVCVAVWGYNYSRPTGLRRERGSHLTQAETRTAESVDELRRSLEGDAVVPGDVQYDAARICFNALIDRRPAVIVRCLGRGDVATAFDFARTNELEIAVRGGGHNPAGHCVLDGGLVIDLSLMRRVMWTETCVSLVRKVARRGSTSTLRRWRKGSRRRAVSSARPASVASRSEVVSVT